LKQKQIVRKLYGFLTICQTVLFNIRKLFHATDIRFDSLMFSSPTDYTDIHRFLFV